MSSIEYSHEALTVVHRFYKVDAMLYVEGEDDIPFWDAVFSLQKSIQITIVHVGGKLELEKYIQKITDGLISNSIVATDADYTHILKTNKDHSLILYTYGYSIENSLFTKESTVEICKILCRKQYIDTEEFNTWHKEFINESTKLIIYDIANDHCNAGISVLTDNCSRFMTTQKSDILCQEKIKSHIAGLSHQIKSESLKLISDEFERTPEIAEKYIRGHFLISGIQKFISNKLKRLGLNSNLSLEQLYVSSILQLINSLKTNHPHFAYYNQQLEKCVQFLKEY